MKALFDHEEEFNQLLPEGTSITAETALDFHGLPYHPGAIRYWKERGVWTADHDARQAEVVAEYAK